MDTHCISGKKRYPTQKAANWALLSCWKKGRHEREAYICASCGGFHLTSAGTRPKGEQQHAAA